jgi:hypothetical protein
VPWLLQPENPSESEEELQSRWASGLILRTTTRTQPNGAGEAGAGLAFFSASVIGRPPETLRHRPETETRRFLRKIVKKQLQRRQGRRTMGVGGAHSCLAPALA